MYISSLRGEHVVDKRGLSNILLTPVLKLRDLADPIFEATFLSTLHGLVRCRGACRRRVRALQHLLPSAHGIGGELYRSHSPFSSLFAPQIVCVVAPPHIA